MSIQDAKEQCLVSLPFELTFHIIASLDDRRNRRNYQKVVFPALKACSLVCRAWNDICRPRIFHRINADICISKGRDSRLSFLHFTAPHLYTYVTDLILFWDRDIYSAPEWIPDALPRFVNLRSLYLECRMSADELTLPLPFALGIMALLNEAPLKRLSLAYWDFSADASDLILLLSVCSTTLEELSLENCSVPDSGTTLPKTIISESSVPPIVCLEALRTVRLQGDFKAFQTSRIETPNLRSLACEYFERPFCSIPSWISDDKVSELRLKVVEVSDILDFGQSICPSSLLIDILKSPEGSFFSVVTWIKRCIEGLPFPNALRKLNIEVRSNQLNEVSNPTRADYELLRRTLQPLHQHGSLQHTNLRIGTLLFNHHTALFDDIATREVEKLRGVFTPLLEANQLTIDVVFERWGQVEEPVRIYL